MEKIKKLFALAANNGSQGKEAETAMRMANALLVKHSIDKYRLHEEDEVFCNFLEYPNTPWIKSICCTIGTFYNCKVIIDNTWDIPKTLVLGTVSNRTTACIVIDQLIEQIKKEAKGKGAAFRNGASHGLWQKCEEIKKSMNKQEEVIPGTGIRVVDIEKRQKIDIDDFVRKNFSGLVTKNSKTVRSAEGKAYGKSLNPNARVQGNGQKRIG